MVDCPERLTHLTSKGKEAIINMMDSGGMTDSGGEPPETRILPNPKICRTRAIEGALTVAECLVDSPYSCPFVLMLNEGGLCNHPNWMGFLEKQAEEGSEEGTEEAGSGK
jgi:hypothetical protein